MQGALDLLRRLEGLGAASLDELNSDEAGLSALDAVVDQGLVRLAGYARGPGCYRLTRRGRHFLAIGRASFAAA